MRYRFAFDVGTNSLGWAVYELNQALEPIDLADAGVRIFSDGRDPKSGESLAVERRGPRAMRRRRDRYLQRRTYLMDLLIKSGLMPEDEADRKALEKLDPYVLRAKGLDQSLTLHEFGRALFHLNQRRGFQSNRIADKKKNDKDKETGKIDTANKELKAALASKTYGQFLAKRHAQRETVRIHLIGKDTKAHYDFYPTRDVLKEEFNRLWDAQAAYHLSVLTINLKARLFEAMFHQRPLKKPVVGKCTFYPEEERLPKWHPLSQMRRIYQDLNHLKIKVGSKQPVPLSLEERDRLAFPLMSGRDLSLAGIRKALKLSADTTTSLEDGGKTDDLIGDQVTYEMAFKKTAPLKQEWGNYSLDQKIDIVTVLENEEDHEALIAYLMTTFNFSQDKAEAVSRIRLPTGYDNLGLTATTQIVEQLKKDVITYNVAVELGIGKPHSDERDGEILPSLPYYGEILQRHTLGGTLNPADKPDIRFGRLANPTVHVGLNQLRRVVNALIRAYGHPEQIAIELARDLKQSKKDKEKDDKLNKENRFKNEVRRKTLQEGDYIDNARNRILLRLWEELGPPTSRFCVYTGRPISLTNLMGGEVEIEHILPFSRTLDDTMANKTLAYREANRGKRNMSPYEGYKNQDQYEAVRQRAKNLPANKSWRFEPEAMERFENSERDFLARQLNETRHLATLARKYMTKITDPNQVWVVTGKLTSLMRDRFGLYLNDHNQKDRNDHRHHAIDACVIGVCDRSLLQKVSRAAATYESKDELKEVTRHIQPPFFDFQERVMRKIEGVVVSHKAERGKGGALHEQTNYSINNAADRDEGELVVRKAIDALTANEIDRVRDLKLREALQTVKYDAGSDAKALATALTKWGSEQKPDPVRRVRILKKEKEFIAIRDHKTGQPYRAVIGGENYSMDIIEDAKGVWHGVATSVFDANQKDFTPKWQTEYSDSKLIMTVHKGDLLRLLDDDGSERIKRVVRLVPSASRFFLADHNESGELQKRHDDPDDKFRWDLATISKLKARKCQLYVIDEIGRAKYTSLPA